MSYQTSERLCSSLNWSGGGQVGWGGGGESIVMNTGCCSSGAWGWEEEKRSLMPCLIAIVSQSQRELSRFFLLASRKVGDLSSFSVSLCLWSSSPAPCFLTRDAEPDGPAYTQEIRGTVHKRTIQGLEMSVPEVCCLLFQGFSAAATCHSHQGIFRSPNAQAHPGVTEAVSGGQGLSLGTR